MPLIDEQTNSVLLGQRQLIKQSSSIGRVNDRSMDAHIAPELLDDENSVTQIENFEATPARLGKLAYDSPGEGQD